MDIKKPGAFWVDYVPLLRHIPTWVPGATARRLGASVKPLVYAMRNEPYAAAKRDFDNGVAEFSVARRMIEDLEVRYSDSPSCYMEQEEVIKDTLGMAYAAGFDTAIVLETLRWMPALPMGNGHRVLVDDEYKGYHIPKESLIIPNIWAMLHDSKDYPFPEDFNPDRFIADGRLNSKVRDPSTIAFGFGRRICPGRAFAKDTLFITVASTLSVFDILPALDGEGESCPLRAEQTSSFISYPESVPCVVKPRSTSAEQLIHTSA
ncbi:hypothetical protein EW026_g5532 [Hermanssonia centrifuga]|uniref:Cytochrome P450 n=1 Tax=Hermanssonia centrifuga TaxID=98765 RepID=A0A4S4KDV9_9APHY|nr:hypothetical protein EW026_g5532 [Hermanssonia centrifuga]